MQIEVNIYLIKIRSLERTNAYNINNMLAYFTKDTLFCALEYDALLVDVL